MIRVRQDWWKDFFDETYLVTDARSVEDTGLTSRETDFLVEAMKLKKKDRILDLCGGHGRHSLELARRGYGPLTVLDYSESLINIGRARAKREGINIDFKKSDARGTGLQGNSFDVVFIMGSSFGYSLKEEHDFSMLREAHRLLKAGGRFLMDLIDRRYVLKNFKPFSSHCANSDITVYRMRSLDNDIVRVREVVSSLSKGVMKDRCYAERLYDTQKIKGMLKDSGFRRIRVKNSALSRKGEGDYGLMTSRTILTAIKESSR